MKGKVHGYNRGDKREWEPWWAWYPKAVFLNYHVNDDDRRWRWVWREWIWIKADSFGDYVYASIEDPREAASPKKKRKRIANVDPTYLDELHKAKEFIGGKDEPV